MYRVYCDGIPIYDTRDENLILIAPVIDLQENTAGSFDFTIHPKHPHYDKIKRMVSVITVVQDNEEIFCGRPIEESSDFYKRKKFHCEGELAYLNDTIQESAEYHNMTIRGYLELLLNAHNAKIGDESKKFYVGAVTVTDSNDSIFKCTNYESTMNVIRTDLLNTFGGRLIVRKRDGKRYLDYLKDYPRTCNQVIKFGENLLDFTKNFDMSDICTVVIPLGANEEGEDTTTLGKPVTIESVNGGKKYLVNDNAKTIYGWVEKVVKFENVHTPSILKDKGLAYLNQMQYENMILEIKAVDLHNLDVNIDKIKLLDEIRAYSTVHGFDKFFPVTKMKIPLDRPSQMVFTLGLSNKRSMTEINHSTQQGIQQEIGNIPSPNSILQQAIDNATQLIHSALNGHVVMRPNELLIMETDNIDTARKVWRWNLNGLGYSSTGYNGTFATAITMDGQIVGSRLVAGSVSAEKIDINYKQSVEKLIETSEQNSNEYTDGKLQGYYTKVETEISIKNTADSILLSAKQTAENTVNSQLKNYSTTAQVKVMVDGVTTIAQQNAEKYVNGQLTSYVQKSTFNVTVNGINSMVSQKIGSDEIISAINQSAEQISINASKINLNGAVTMNNNVQIDSYGRLHAVNGSFEGSVTATSGKFTGTINAVTMVAEGKYYIVDSDFNKKMPVIESVQDGSSDTKFNIGKLASAYSGSRASYISFWDIGSEPYMDFYADGFTFKGNAGDFNIEKCDVYIDQGRGLFDSEGQGIVYTDTNNKIYFGPSAAQSSTGNETALRGDTVRLYSHTKGAVYLGGSGSTAITSDETQKNIFDINERYERFFEKLKPIDYVYKNHGHRHHLGFGARAVEQALLASGLTTEDFAGVLIDKNVTLSADEMGTEQDVFFPELYSLRLAEFIALNTHMIQKLMKRVDMLERI